MKNYKKYLWYIPALYIVFMFCSKLIDGLNHSQEFIDIISTIPFLKSYAYTLAPFVGIFDTFIAIIFLFNMNITGNVRYQNILFLWVALWPNVPAFLRVIGGVGQYELLEVLSIAAASLISWILFKKFYLQDKNKTA